MSKETQSLATTPVVSAEFQSALSLRHVTAGTESFSDVAVVTVKRKVKDKIRKTEAEKKEQLDGLQKMTADEIERIKVEHGHGESLTQMEAACKDAGFDVKIRIEVDVERSHTLRSLCVVSEGSGRESVEHVCTQTFPHPELDAMWDKCAEVERTFNEAIVRMKRSIAPWSLEELRSEVNADIARNALSGSEGGKALLALTDSYIDQIVDNI